MMLTLRTFLQALFAAVVSASLVSHASAQPSAVRKVPFPFSHMVTIASDADQTEPWHLAAMHDVINRKLGLPISSSLWSQGRSRGAASFFGSHTGLNRAPSEVSGLPVFAALLREWHSGNLDHFHSWQDDATYGLRDEFNPPLKMTGGELTINIEPAPSNLSSMFYQNLRIIFDKPPPSDLSIVARDANDKVVTSNFLLMQNNAAVFGGANLPNVVELILDPQNATAVSGTSMDDGFRLVDLRELSLKSRSCGSGCEIFVVRVERDSYSRQTVRAQLPWLEAWNVRPLVYTSHGGWTFSQNLWLPGRANFELPKSGHPSVLTSLRGLLDDPNSPSFISDQLRQLGVQHIWPYDNGLRQLNLPPPELSRSGTFYLLTRNMAPNMPTDTFDSFKEAMTPFLPSLGSETLAGLYCNASCGNDQGSMMAIPLIAMFQHLSTGGHADNIFYTHLGTGDNDWVRTPRQPLKQSVERLLFRLSRHYYNFDSDVSEGQRIWVPPVTTAARYRALMSRVAAHVSVSGDTVTIMPWRDEVTGRTVPSPDAGTRDLHGLTVYVDDAATAKVRIGDRNTDSFTRNGPDTTGRPSITLVDDHLPTRIAGSAPIERLGSVSTYRSVLAGPEWPEVGRETEPSALRIDAPRGGDAWVTVLPRNFKVENITHFRLAYRHTGQIPSTGRLFIELKFEAGHRVTIAEGAGSEPELNAQTGWWIARAKAQEEVRRMLPLSQMIWSRSEGAPRTEPLPVPLGKIVEFRIGLLGSSAGESVEIMDLAALRPSGNSTSPDGTMLLAGRVTEAGRPMPGTAIRMIDQAGRVFETETDTAGLYFIPNLKKGIAVYLAAKAKDGKICAPVDSTVRYMDRDEVSADIELDSCIGLPVQGERMYSSRKL